MPRKLIFILVSLLPLLLTGCDWIHRLFETNRLLDSQFGRSKAFNESQYYVIFEKTASSPEIRHQIVLDEGRPVTFYQMINNVLVSKSSENREISSTGPLSFTINNQKFEKTLQFVYHQNLNLKISTKSPLVLELDRAIDDTPFEIVRLER